MSSKPCIVFSAFRSGSDPLVGAWATFRQQVHSTGPKAVRLPAVPSGETRPGIWRLLASNNREVARSSFLYGSFVTARRHVLSLQASVDDIEVTVVNGPTAGTHGWFASLDSGSVMTCARWYGASASSLEAALVTLEALRGATVPDDARLTSSAGQRSRAGALRGVSRGPAGAAGETW